MLVRPDYIPGTLANASGQQLEANTGLWLTKLHDIINKARAAIDSEDVKVWELNTVPEMAYASLGIAPTSPLRTAVSGVAGIVQLIEDVKAFEGLTAAGDVSLDPALRDLAKGERDLLALALDILALRGGRDDPARVWSSAGRAAAALGARLGVC